MKIDRRTKSYKKIYKDINVQIEKALKDLDLPNTQLTTSMFAKLWLEDLQQNPLEVGKILKKQLKTLGKKETLNLYFCGDYVETNQEEKELIVMIMNARISEKIFWL